MRKSRFSESQIVGILKDADGGVPVADSPPEVRGQPQPRRSARRGGPVVRGAERDRDNHGDSRQNGDGLTVPMMAVSA